MSSHRNLSLGTTLYIISSFSVHATTGTRRNTGLDILTSQDSTDKVHTTTD